MFSRAIRILWHLALVFGLILAFQRSFNSATQISEAALGCDSFGYLNMARSMRRGTDFRIETPQARLLIDYLKSRRIPHGQWDEFVAPHAHHYSPVSDRVAVQYPPGTAAILEKFPEGHAVHGLNLLTEWALFAGALLTQILCFICGAWVSSGYLALSFFLGFEILRNIGTVSFSVNACLLPMFFGTVFLYGSLFLAEKRKRQKSAVFSAFAAGGLFGFCILIRIPALLLLPGLALLLIHHRRLVTSFASGVVLFGLIPLAFHQHHVAGAWYLSTYNAGDASGPKISAILSNLNFYLGTGPGARYDWAPLFMFLGLIGFRFVGLKRVVLGSLLIWAIPTFYFLTHAVTAFYYLAPSTFAFALALSFGILALESGTEQKTQNKWATALAVIPGLVLLSQFRFIGSSQWPDFFPAARGPAWSAEIPQELMDPAAWIWSDETSGTLWYYGRKASFKAPFSDTRLRADVSKFIKEQRGRMFLVLDSSKMNSIEEELRQAGARMVLRGRVFDFPYIRVDWE